jgi:hypothetical protein
VLVLTGLVPVAASEPAAAPTAPARPVTDDLDLTAIVPALQSAFGERYGGFWIDARDHLHVQVVGARGPDRAAVRALTAGHPRVVTDAVARGYDALVAAQEEVAAALDPAPGGFAVDLDVPGNGVVVRTAGGAAPTTAVARAAARRGAARHAARHRAARHRAAGAAAATADTATTGTTGTTAADTAADMADAVTVVPHARIALTPLGSTRNSFPPNEAGLGVTIARGRTLLRCTTGYQFRNAYGHFGTTAGHCGLMGDGLAIGRYWVDTIRINGYQGRATVRADVSGYALNIHPWLGRPVVHVQGGIHRRVVSRYTNAQLSAGMRLCFEGITSDGGNCGSVVRANSVICCDAGHHTFVFSCINYASRAGDSGSPVYANRPDGTVVAAGALSSNVTINGQTLMCFSNIANIEALMGTLVRG